MNRGIAILGFVAAGLAALPMALTRSDLQMSSYLLSDLLLINASRGVQSNLTFDNENENF